MANKKTNININMNNTESRIITRSMKRAAENNTSPNSNQPTENSVGNNDGIDINIPSTSSSNTGIRLHTRKRRPENVSSTLRIMEDEGDIDVVNLTDTDCDSPLKPVLKITRYSPKKRNGSTFITIDISPASTVNNNNLPKTSDNSAKKKKVTEIINLDDSDNGDATSTSTSKSQTARHLGDCPICMQDLSGKEKMSTICGHVFCAECIQNIIKTTKRCPNCRNLLTLKSIHPLYI